MDATSLHETCFKACWEKFARANKLPDDPTAPVPKANVAELRRAALEWFSWGCVHQTETRRRLDGLLPRKSASMRRRKA